MNAWRDRFNQFTGKTRLAVCRVFVQLTGEEVAPLLGVLNHTAREGIDKGGDLAVLGEGLVEICNHLLQYDNYWQAAANEGDIFWDEGEAGDYVEEIFTDSADRYLSEPQYTESVYDKNSPLSLPVTTNVVVMIAVAYEGEVPALETDLADISALKIGLKALINLNYQQRLRALQIHFSPAQLGDELTNDQVLVNFPELIPL